MKHKTICLILAAGTGSRLASEIPKQFVDIAGMPLIRHSALTFLNHALIDGVRIVYNSQNKELYNKILSDLPLLSPVEGGKSRQESSYLGLKSLKQYNPVKILIHDAARPFIGNDIITNVITALDKHIAVLPVIPIQDTVKIVQSNIVKETANRENLFLAQTPQGFIYNEILSAYEEIERLVPRENWEKTFTDDVSILEHLKKEVKIVAGTKKNFKITTQEDIEIANTYAK